MPAGPQRSARRKRLILRIVAAVVAVPLVLLIAGNLWLATPWAREWLAGKVAARTGLDATVGCASVTPWGGAFVGGVELRQPAPLRAAIDEPFMKVGGIRVVPRWERWLKGEFEIAEVHVEDPQFVVAVEMLATLASSAPPPVPASPPAIVALSPSPPADGTQPTPALPVPGLVTPPATAPAAPGPGSLTVDWPETSWIVVTGARLELRSAAVRGSLGGISEVDARIPVAGKPAPSMIKIGRIDLLGREIASGWSVPLAWNPPELRAGPCDLGVGGLKVKFAAVAGRVPGAPFAVEVTVPPQPFDGSPFFHELRPSAERVEARVQGIGLLRVPSSWQGLAQVVAQRPAITLGGEVRRFDEARAAAVLQGGQLHCPDFRLTGDRLSLLGNGRFGGGQGSAVVRLVVPPGDAQDISRRFTLPGMAAGPVFKELGTPDRVFLDLRWISYSGGQGVELGEGGPVVPSGELGRLFPAVGAN